MISALPRRRRSLAWLLLMVPLAVGLAWLASVPLLRASRTLLDPGLETCHRWAGTDGLPRHYFIGAESTMLREVIGPLEPARLVAVLEDLLGGHSIGHIGARPSLRTTSTDRSGTRPPKRPRSELPMPRSPIDRA